MRSENRNDHEHLQREIRSEQYTALLRRLVRTAPFLEQFSSWGEVISFMREGSSKDPRKDEVLRPILQAHAEDMDPRWRTVLLVIFYPGLDSILNRKARWDADKDERWHNLVWAFLQAVCRLDLSKRSERLVQKLINDTIRRFHDEYCRIWKRMRIEIATDPGHLPDLTGGEEIDTDEMDRREARDAEVKRLRAHMEAGRISEADFLLLVGTRVYGKSAAQYARETGMSIDLARKRRLRAEAAIRRAEEEK